MKNKTRIIDVSMLSSYMGRWLTLFVTIAVVLIALSAIFNGDLGSRRDIIQICVQAGIHPGESANRFEPLRALVSRESKRPAVLVECAGEWPADFDLFVMPLDQFFRHADDLPITPLYEIRVTERNSDKAILIAGPAGEGMEPSGAKAGDVAFADPRSVNGFWLQADYLEKLGAGLGAGGYRFEGTRDDATPVIYSVLHGKYPWGACKLSELASLIDRGILKSGELRVIHSEDALPDIVIGARTADSSYYTRKLGAVATLLEETELAARRDDTVDLLKSHGVRRLEPVTSPRIERAAALFDRFEAAHRAESTIRP